MIGPINAGTKISNTGAHVTWPRLIEKSVAIGSMKKPKMPIKPREKAKQMSAPKAGDQKRILIKKLFNIMRGIDHFIILRHSITIFTDNCIADQTDRSIS